MNKLIGDFLSDTIIVVGLNNISIIEKYLQTVNVQLDKAGELAMAELSVFHIIEERNFNKVEQYIQGFSQFRNYMLNQYKIVKSQAVFRGWLVRKKFILLKKAAITIQRGWR